MSERQYNREGDVPDKEINVWFSIVELTSSFEAEVAETSVGKPSLIEINYNYEMGHGRCVAIAQLRYMLLLEAPIPCIVGCYSRCQ